ncbi:hypothetical protein EVAR_36045_1 [Eumeta japonica]|uniref:Uncharacterized protein n=1 Tax=Eumeta variegata TaxID=151549 RepID=A0A4C1WU62_EUMVA|nr:hypothetical protein EVAR_36045_1 [Eumeta japonica]
MRVWKRRFHIWPPHPYPLPGDLFLAPAELHKIMLRLPEKEGPGTRWNLYSSTEIATKEGDGGYKQSIQWDTENWSLPRELKER